MRTRQTAQFIASEISSEVLVDEAFAEISFGDWDGLTNAEVLAKYPTEYEAWRGSFELAPPNGESLCDFEHRVRAGLNKLLCARSGEAIVIVSHVMPIRALLKLALNGSVETYWRQTVNPCSLTILRFWDEATAEVVVANSCGHLI
jgi:probable phosphoglycerate mutase